MEGLPVWNGQWDFLPNDIRWELPDLHPFVQRSKNP